MKPAPDIAPFEQDIVVNRPRPSRFRGLLVLVALLAATPLLIGDYYLYIAAQVVIFAVATLGLDILYGRTGQLSLAHASFFGLGAYAAGIASAYEVAVWWQPAIVVAVALLAGALVAIPTLRLSGLRLAVVTLLFGELFRWGINHSGQITGGSQGMSVPPLEIGAFDSTIPLHAYLLASVVAVLATAFCIQLGSAQVGRRMLAIRDSETASTSLGIHIVRTKVVAFMLSAVLAGLAGWVYAYTTGFISPTTFDLFASVYFLVAVILGGPGKVLGAWLGALYIVLLPEAFNTLGYPNLFPILGGAVLIIVALMMPGGLVGAGTALAERLRRRGTPAAREGTAA